MLALEGSVVAAPALRLRLVQSSYWPPLPFLVPVLLLSRRSLAAATSALYLSCRFLSSSSPRWRSLSALASIASRSSDALRSVSVSTENRTPRAGLVGAGGKAGMGVVGVDGEGASEGGVVEVGR